MEKFKPTGDPLSFDMANALRFLSADAVQKANSGHPGMPMGMADVATVLFRNYFHINPKKPNWPDRDRFVLSAGHGSMLLYALNYLVGYEDMTIEQIKQFRQLGSITAGHPEYGHALGIETTTGPLGQGLATAVGMAIAERMGNARFGDELMLHYTYVIAGDGCLQEGISQEAIDLAGHLGLNRLIVFWDDNRISIDGATQLSTSCDQVKRFEASNWSVQSINGHDHDEINRAILNAYHSGKPCLIACRTQIGYGAPNLMGSEKAHGAPLGEDEIKAAREILSWPYQPFEIPKAVLDEWRKVTQVGQAKYEAWQHRMQTSKHTALFKEIFDNEIPDSVCEALAIFKESALKEQASIATRKSSQMVLEVINAKTHMTAGGSADLTHSNLTLTKEMKPVDRQDFSGRYIHYGIREHAMSAAMNGIALHGGFVPYGGTFLVFSDYARGAMRLSALMGAQVIYVLTHDSIGLGEDGPTHQPIEHYAMLRATPNLNFIRPCDMIEVAEAWELALQSKHTPTVLALSRQNLPRLRKTAKWNETAKGAYILSDGDDPENRDLTLIATGSEVAIAMEAQARIKVSSGLNAFVVSMPCWEFFEAQPQAYKQQVLGDAPRIAIEAASGFGWERWVDSQEHFIGMKSFGASAPAKDLYRHFNITAEAVTKLAKKIVN